MGALTYGTATSKLGCTANDRTGFAPVLGVNKEPQSTVIGLRSAKRLEYGAALRAELAASSDDMMFGLSNGHMGVAHALAT